MHIPRVITCSAGQWTLVASGVVRAIVQKKTYGPWYAATYRDHNKTAPINFDSGFSWNDEQLDVRSKERIDVYIYVGQSDTSGDGNVEVYI